MAVTIRFRGVAQAFRELREELGDEVAQNFDTQTFQLVENLRDATPVDTGNARDSWFITPTSPEPGDPTDVRAVIFNTTDYIDDLNAGTSRQAPARFIEREALQLFEPDGVIVQRSIRTA